MNILTRNLAKALPDGIEASQPFEARYRTSEGYSKPFIHSPVDRTALAQGWQVRGEVRVVKDEKEGPGDLPRVGFIATGESRATSTSDNKTSRTVAFDVTHRSRPRDARLLLIGMSQSIAGHCRLPAMHLR
jgi:hypothetical protein